MQIVIDIHEEEYNDVKYFGTIVDEDRDYIAECILNGTPLPKEYNGKNDVLDKIIGYVDHIRNTGMGKKKSLEFIEKFIEGLKAESYDLSVIEPIIEADKEN